MRFCEFSVHDQRIRWPICLLKVAGAMIPFNIGARLYSVGFADCSLSYGDSGRPRTSPSRNAPSPSSACRFSVPNIFRSQYAGASARVCQLQIAYSPRALVFGVDLGKST